MGSSLLEKISLATGLPGDIIQMELRALLKASGKNEETVTLDDLREILVEYLQDVMLQAKDDASA